MNAAATNYDPFNREDDRELEQSAALRQEHEAWSLEQSKLGNTAEKREAVGTWVRLGLPPEPEARS